MITKHLYFFIIPLILYSCENDPAAAPPEHTNINEFIIPDSINTAEIYAAYREPEAYSILLSNGPDRLIKLCYTSDGNVIRDTLRMLRYNEYKSVSTMEEYTFHDSVIRVFGKTGSNLDYNWQCPESGYVVDFLRKK